MNHWKPASWPELSVMKYAGNRMKTFSHIWTAYSKTNKLNCLNMNGQRNFVSPRISPTSSPQISDLRKLQKIKADRTFLCVESSTGQREQEESVHQPPWSLHTSAKAEVPESRKPSGSIRYILRTDDTKYLVMIKKPSKDTEKVLHFKAGPNFT